MKFCVPLSELRLSDISRVGGKSASLGQMIADLGTQGIAVPDGFAVTADAYWYVIRHNNLEEAIESSLRDVHLMHKQNDLHAIKKTGHFLRSLFEQAELPKDLVQEIIQSYKDLCAKHVVSQISVAIRSSATAEDLPEASFAGQQESYLNVRGIDAVLDAYKKCLASLFTDRALVYRQEKGFDHQAIALSVCIQRMVRSDKACSGVMFTIDTETGFKNSVIITGSYGLGESIVQGEVVPDEFHVFKPSLQHKDKDPIIKKECGSKKIKRVYAAAHKTSNTVVLRKVTRKDAERFCLTDQEVVALARMAICIEDYYARVRGSWAAMDIEWAKDGITQKLWIVQARAETIHSTAQTSAHLLTTYALKDRSDAQILVTGQSIGQKIACGKARVIETVQENQTVQDGDIIVTHMTDPDWVPVMKKAAAIITESGGRTCHTAIVSRELGIPALVGATGALKKIQQGQGITLDCSTGSEGTVYDKILEVVTKTTELTNIKKPAVAVNVNIAAPDYAYALSKLPVAGVGLARLEFIISNTIQVHPMACAEPERITDTKMKQALQYLSRNYANPADFFVYKVAQGIAMIAAAFYPRPVLVRFSDFKSNEYRGLLAGMVFEPYEENPMIGLRGASRYYSSWYAPAFLLECAALRYVRETMGFTNVNVMVPFVRTLQEAEKVTTILREQKLILKEGGPEVYMMCELPSNVLLLKEFARYFDGFSIGSNDLTQTTLSVDRDSGLLTSLFDESDPAVMSMLKMAITAAREVKKPIGICGQAPSDNPEIAQFLIDCGISSLSLNPDSVLSFMMGD